MDVQSVVENGYEAMGDDMNTPVLLGHMFDGVRIINSLKDGKEKISATDLDMLHRFMTTFAFDLLGLVPEETPQSGALTDKVIRLLLQQRQDAKARKDYAASDQIRQQLTSLGILVKDTRDGAEWEME
jgi:cysteinyl-tRNA synthetase